MHSEYAKTTYKVGIVTLIGNLLLSLGKFIVGILASASSLVSDAIHSLSDVLSTVVVLIGAKLAEKAPDKEHPYGHERFESIASIILAMILVVTAIFLGYTGVQSIISLAKGNLPSSQSGIVVYLALGFALLSILVKGAMFFYTLSHAKRIRSSLLKADAFHHLTDSISSVASLIGIVGLMLGGNFVYLDPVASIIIALFILKVGLDVAFSAVNEVVDKSAPESFAKEVEETASKHPGVLKLNSIKTRTFGNKYYVELEIAVDSSLSVKEGHEIAKTLHNAIESAHPEVKHCMIHVDPFGEEPED